VTPIYVGRGGLAGCVIGSCHALVWLWWCSILGWRALADARDVVTVSASEWRGSVAQAAVRQTDDVARAKMRHFGAADKILRY
jgi:hypothetical protein